MYGVDSGHAHPFVGFEQGVPGLIACHVTSETKMTTLHYFSLATAPIQASNAPGRILADATAFFYSHCHSEVQGCVRIFHRIANRASNDDSLAFLMSPTARLWRHCFGPAGNRDNRGRKTSDDRQAERRHGYFPMPGRGRRRGVAEAGSGGGGRPPDALTRCGGARVHHVCDGATVEVREVSGEEPGTLRARIQNFRDRMEPLPALARDCGESGSGDALNGAALDDASRAFGQDFGWVLGELDGAHPDLDATGRRLRGNALARSAWMCRAVPEARDAKLPAPGCPAMTFG